MTKCILRIPLSITLVFLFSAAFTMIFNAPVEAQIPSAARAANPASPGGLRQSLGDFLAPDGRVDLKGGYRGSLDLQGCQMVGASGEAPGVAVEAVAGNERWAEDFRPVGMDGGVETLAADGRGNVYAGGTFVSIGGVTVNHIAMWDGSKWSPLGSGMNGRVYALVIDGNGNLYAGGLFTTAGGVPANWVAKWNGIEWSALESGFAGEPGFDDARTMGIHALAMDENGRLYAGGQFSIAGGVKANNVARWDGARWSALGSGIGPKDDSCSTFVKALAIDQSGNLYAGGDFSTAGGIEAGHIARWDGANWSAIRSGVNGIVTSIAIDVDGSIYAGGHFTSAGGVAANNLAKWNGGGWAPLGPGISGGQYDYVWALAMDGYGNLIVGGRFITEGRVTASGIARWNGREWSSFGSGLIYRPLGDCVLALCLDQRGSLYAGGYFAGIGGIAASHFAKWDGGRWTTVAGGSGISNDDGSASYVMSIAADGRGAIYAAGRFEIAGNALAENIGKWNGTEWAPMGSGPGESTDDLIAVDLGGNTYRAGWFSSIGGVRLNHIAKWNGSKWSALGKGVNGNINALAVDQSGNLYVGGDFTRAGGIHALHIAKWNGSEWSALGKGIDGRVYALAVDGSGNLYAGGDFSRAGGITAFNVAKWDGNHWSALSSVEEVHAQSSGFDDTAHFLAVDARGDLYAGSNGSSWIYEGSIARWNGTEWFYIVQEIEGGISALATDEIGNLYAAGYFTEIGGVAANRIAKWNGREWSALGAGMNDAVLALAADVGGNIYAGGLFSTAGEKPSSRIAKWKGRPALAVDFPSEGLQLWDGRHKKISSQHPNVLSTWGDRLVVSFPTLGLYLHDGSAWEKLSSLKSTESVLGIGDSLYVDAGIKGVYRYKGGWTRIHTTNPTMMAACGEKLVANFPEIGLWAYDGSEWKRISSWTGAEQMVGIEKRLFVDFGARGIYRYDGAWMRITTQNPGLMHAFGKTLATSIDSTSTPGIYLYRNNSWTRISSNPSAEGFASTPFTLYIDRGAQGIAKYEKKSWKTITPYNPDRIAIYGGKLAAVIPDKGLHLYSNHGWNRLSTVKDAGLMQGVLFE